MASDYIAPGSENERLVAVTWQEVLDLEKVGVHQNFFDLGGNSRDFIKVNRKLQEQFQKEITLVMMFKSPTIQTFAHYLEQENFDRVIDRAEEKRQGDSRLERMRNMRKGGRQHVSRHNR